MPIRRATDDYLEDAGPSRSRPAPAFAILVVALALVAGCAFGRDDAFPGTQRPSNKWRVAFEQTASSDGSIDFLVAPVSGNAMTVSVPVAIKQTEEEIAKAAHAAFSGTLGDRYEVDPPTGSDIHVEKVSRKQPDFSLTLIRLTAQDVKVDIDRE